jgi:hypothetical protein
VRKGEVIISEFFSDSYSMSLDDGRWFPVTLYADKTDKTGSVPGAASGGKEEAERVAAGESVNANFNVRDAVTRAAIKIQAHYRGYAVRKAYKLYKVGGQVSELLYSPGSGEAAPKTGTCWAFPKSRRLCSHTRLTLFFLQSQRLGRADA